MIRLAHIADLHADERGRLDDLHAVLDAFVKDAHAANVNAVVIAGDLYERRSTPAERNVVAAFVIACARLGPVFVCKGNHDAAGDLDILGRLDTVWGVHVVDGATAAPGSAIVRAIDDAGNDQDVAFLALSWFDKAHLVAGLDADVSGADTTERTIKAARGLLDAIRAEAARVAACGRVPILAAHVLVAGSETSTGQTLIGTTVELSPADLADVGCAYVALGHIHKRQGWGRVWYSGSPQRNNFGEPEPKGWNLITIDPDRWREPDGVRIEFRELPAREIALVEVDWTAEGGPHADAYPYAAPGALVRFRYRVRVEDLARVDEDAIREVYARAGAHDVVVEAIVEHNTRVRSGAIVEARDTWAKLVAYWDAKGIEVPDATRARLRGKLDEIETRQRDAAGVVA